MLVVTTTVRMVDWVHSGTNDSGESLSHSFVFEVKGTGFHDGFFVSSSSGNDTYCGSAVSIDGFSGTRWQSNSCF